MKPSKDTNRMADVIDCAEAAFWDTVAHRYPEAECGDFCPDASSKLNEALIEAVTLWVRTNADPYIQPEPKYGVTEILLHRVEYVYYSGANDKLGDTDREHIAYNISCGIDNGTLERQNMFAPSGDMVIVGKWEINNCPISNG